jgi:hypothetical protein
VEKDVHLSVDWSSYFKHIRTECPWSYSAYTRGLIDIVHYKGDILPLGPYQARVYIVDLDAVQVEALAKALDYGLDEWLFSYPGYGDWATPTAVLIQQNRAELNQIRAAIK